MRSGVLKHFRNVELLLRCNVRGVCEARVLNVFYEISRRSENELLFVFQVIIVITAFLFHGV